MKKAIICLVAVFSLFLITGCDIEETNTTSETTNEVQKEIYNIKSGDLGEYGKEIVLNKNTDAPSTKYLYKLPSGNYEVSTTNEKYSTFWIVKDEVVQTGTPSYPEELNYVGEQYMLTASDNLLNGKATNNANITLNDDESILLIMGDLSFTKE